MNCGRESNVIYFDLRDVNSEILASGSIYNEGSCAFAMTIIEGLILAGVPGSKVILTPYQGQYRILMSALQIMTKTHPEAEEVDVDKIDRCQGSEWDICVIDITRTSGVTQGSQQAKTRQAQARQAQARQAQARLVKLGY